jgi:FAD/FMN-containing dehydrogenase
VEKVTATTTTWVTELQDAFGADGVLLDPDVTAAYARDEAMLAPAGTPAAVVFARSTADVVIAMQVHRAIKDALDPQGLLNPGKVFRMAGVRDLAGVTAP